MKKQYNIEPNDNQTVFFNTIADHDIVVDSGTWRSGKTFELCLFAILRMISYPGIREFIGRKTLKSIKETTFLKFQEVLTEHMGLIENKDFWVNRSSNPTIRLYTGSIAVFGDLDPNTINKWLSAEYSDILIDEGQEVSEICFEKIASRQTQTIIEKMSDGTKRNKIAIAMNPPEIAHLHWAHKKFRDPKTKIKNSAIIYSNIEANRANIPENYIDSMYSTVDKRTADLYLKGYWKPLNTNLVFSDYSFPQDDTGNYIEGGNLKRFEYRPELDNYISMDFGWAHDMVMGFWQYDRIKDEHYRLYEYVNNHTKPHEYCKLLAGLELEKDGKIYSCPINTKNAKIIVGAEAKQSRQEGDGVSNIEHIRTEMAKYGIVPHIEVSAPRILNSISLVRSYILTATGKRKLFIHIDDCRRFIQDASIYHYKTDKEGNITGELPDKDDVTDHTQDETRYYINKVTPLEENIMYSQRR